MEHLDLPHLLKSLMPVLIFVVWALFSLPNNKKKKDREALKRRKLEELERAETQVSRDENGAHDLGKQPTPKSEWKRSIEQVFEEMGFPLEKEQKSPPPEMRNEPSLPQSEKTGTTHSHNTRTVSSLPKDSRSLEDLEPEIPVGKPPEKTHTVALPVKDGAYSLAASPIDDKKAYAQTSLSGTENSSYALSQNLTGKISPHELQKFVVWSELLGKPVALREEP
jgi:hypothetical protein